MAVRIWLTEVLVSGFNYFVLMNLIYEPRWGKLAAHQIGMSSRIVYITGFAYLLQRYGPRHDRRDLVHVGVLWLALTLLFEWGGSLLLLRRPVSDIVVGWQVWKGYMWPYVLAAYALSNLLVGLALRPSEQKQGPAAISESRR